MKTIKFLIILSLGLLLTACETEYKEDPNRAVVAPTHAIMNRVQKRFMDRTRDVWFSGRQSLLWVQYWNQVNYTDEDRFEYRETVNKNSWDDIYINAQNLIDLISYNTNEDTKADMLKYGPNENQIAAARIMLVYIYLHGLELWGDIPYWSYQSTNETFQANKLKSDGISHPAYAKQKDIYADMLKTLKEAQESIITNKIMIAGDNFYNGDATGWKKFANSLRLRIANRIKNVYPEAQAHIDDAIAQGVFASNADNAGLHYETNAINAAPMYRAFYVDNRTDFAPSMSFVELLQGKRGPFGIVDPRLDIFVDDNVDGFKVGIPLVSSNDEVNDFQHESLPGAAILAPNYTEYYMEYSEVCFIMSEIKNWDQTWYEKGVRASMEKWGVAPSAINDYIAALPPANEENVMTQKYIALYMQPMEAWSELRRTGYPNTLIRPNETYTYTYPTADGDVSVVYTFTPKVNLDEIPSRNMYLSNEKNINFENYSAAKTSMGGDTQSTKLWWQP